MTEWWEPPLGWLGENWFAAGTLAAAAGTVIFSAFTPMRVQKRQEEAAAAGLSAQHDSAQQQADFAYRLRTQDWLREQRFATYSDYLASAQRIEALTLDLLVLRRTDPAEGGAADHEARKAAKALSVYEEGVRHGGLVSQALTLADKGFTETGAAFSNRLIELARRTALEETPPLQLELDFALSWRLHIIMIVKDEIGILSVEDKKLLTERREMFPRTSA